MFSHLAPNQHSQNLKELMALVTRASQDIPIVLTPSANAENFVIGMSQDNLQLGITLRFILCGKEIY